MADGATQSEALANVQKVIDEWIATAKELGREIPKAKGKLIHA
jgi:predicted RNase H-like HicB family nuclease